jgi:hypothetical protein
VGSLRDTLAERFPAVARRRIHYSRIAGQRCRTSFREPREGDRRHPGRSAAPEIRRKNQKASAKAVAARRSQARARHDDRARELGHTDLPALLAATSHLSQRALTALIGISPMEAGRLRKQERDR